jgi:hypothetical protein
MKDTGLDNYYDLIIILGKTSVLVEQYYNEFDDDQLDSIDSFYETIFFHIDNRSCRRVVLGELEAMIKYIDGELKDMNL